MNKTDLFIIGSGSGGRQAATRAVKQGAKVIVAEHSKIGGTCVNLGCVPKKLMAYSSDFGYTFADAAAFGWQLPEGATPSYDWPKMRTALATRIKRLNEIHATTLADAGIELVHGKARLAGPNTVVVDDQEYEAEAILVATGGRPAVPSAPGLAEHAIVSDDIFSLDSLPRRAVIAGAGYIAVEFACILAGYGVEVTLLHRGPTVLKNFDIDIQARLLEEMERLGVTLQLNSTLDSLERNGDELVVRLADSATLTCDLYLSATGRSPNIDGLELDKAGVEVGKRGEIVVDDSYQTSVPSVYAIGDVIGRMALTPVAIAEAIRFVALKYGGVGPEVNYAQVPTAVFTHPNVGTVGMTEQQAREQHPDCEVHKTVFPAMLNGITGRQDKTLIKIINEKDGGRVLGAHMVGAHAGETIQGIAVAVAKGTTKLEFDAVVGIHPTSAEEFVSLR